MPVYGEGVYGAGQYGFAGYPSFELTTDSATGYLSLADYVYSYSGAEAVADMDDNTVWGSSWQTLAYAGRRTLQAVTLNGFYDDDGAAAHWARLARLDTMGTSVWLRCLWSPTDTMEIRSIVSQSETLAVTRALTRLTVELRPKAGYV